GAVGIGTGAPATGLHVVSTPPGGTPWIGSLLLEPSTHPYSGALSIKSTLSSGVTNRVWTLLSGYATDAPGIFRIYDGNVHQDRIVIDLDGKVGIGTTAPATGLHLVKTPIQGSPWIGSVLLEPATHPFTAALSIKSTNTSGATNRIWSLLSGFGSDGYGDFRIYDSVAQRDGLRIDDYGQVFVNSLYAQGTLYGSVKYFQIPHPQNPDKKLLTHSSLEGPEIGVTYRGEAQLQEGEVSVGLPAYFEALTRSEQRTVHLTPVEGWSPLYVVSKVREGRFVVRTAKGGDPNQRFYWEVRAVRADVGLLQAESDVPTGHPIVRMGAPVTRTE
ncbi:MAG: hypothetical protein WC713_04945, partial [Candidatus Methylomirabilota bacterium]